MNIMKTLVPTPSLRTLVLLALLLAANSTRASVRYVWQDSPSPGPPYTNWTTAAHVIQDAVDAAVAGDEIVVTNGTYATGGRAVYGTMSNRVAVDKPVVVRSVKGPQFTVIQGYQVPGMTNGDGAIRCVYLTSGASLSGFTLTNGATRKMQSNDSPDPESDGGGLWCEYAAVASNCVVSGSTAYRGGGAYGGTLNNCVLTGNSARWGGGVFSSTLSNCTLTGNTATSSGGGAYQSTLNNCIVYFNTAQEGENYYQYYWSEPWNNCCTTPLPAGGAGNISLDPQLASASHLSGGSPCRGAGIAAYATGTDIDGEPWRSPPSIGCDEYHPGAVTGPLIVGIAAAFTNVSAGYPVGLTAVIEGRTTASAWDFGDGLVASNRPYASHAWATPGDYAVILRAYNESLPSGVGESVMIHVVAPPVHYVSAESTNPVSPYTTWTTAATNIQDAVDAVAPTEPPGTSVLVTNGTYATGGRAVGTNVLVNRVAVDKPLTVRSVNGPQFTVIQGRQVPGTTNGDGAIRCAYLGNGASLCGFTLTNGATGTNWDYFYPLDQNGGGVCCESTSAVVSNCVLTSNSAYSGGGAYGGTLNNCTLTGNSTTIGPGGGAVGDAFSFSEVRFCTLNNCTLTGNSAAMGGGAFGCTLNNCTVTGNSASWAAGGAGWSTLNNCSLTGNWASSGGGAMSAVLNNCTLTRNAAESGGGVQGGGDMGGPCRLNNCIVYYNTASLYGANYSTDGQGVVLNYCCTTPDPGGVGNITADPQLASASHLSGTSPCRGAGSADYASGTDIDGEAWVTLPSIGCDEYHAGAVTGPLSVGIVAAYTNVAVGFPVDLTALIEGRTTSSVWNFGDGVVMSNRPYANHAWAVAGDCVVVLRAYNESLPGGVSATVTVHVVGPPVHYVAVESTNPLPPYTSWATAATNIQDAVDAVAAAAVPGTWILVTNGTYATGGRAVFGTMTNRVAVDKPLILRSVNGPQFTVIQGYQVPGTTNGDGAIRCVYLANGASLSGFTLTNGATGTNWDWTNWDYSRDQKGGGICCESTSAELSNCVLTGNSASSDGGGAYGGTLNNCTLTGNSVPGGNGGGAAYCTLYNCRLTGNSALAPQSGSGGQGGGAESCTLYNCTLTGNAANFGGGTAWGTLNNCTLTGNSATNSGGGAVLSTLNNCIAYFNTAPNGANYSQVEAFGILNYCCTTPMPTNGVGNITNVPLFVDYAGGNLRLQSNSPCINAGLNAYAPGQNDQDGNPRIVSGTVDVGAYEFQGPGSVISYAWLQQYGLPIDGSADYTDPDHDGLNNWQEWRCGTCPTNANSALRLLSPQRTGTTVTVTWQSVAGVNYFLERSTNLGASAPFSPLVIGIPGQAGLTSYADTNAAPLALLFYRVGVGQ